MSDDPDFFILYDSIKSRHDIYKHNYTSLLH
jgi:hypothetical protein